MKNYHIYFVFRENSDFPCLHLHNGKDPSQDYFLAVKCLFVDSFSKFLWQFLRRLGNKRMIRSHFAGGVSEQVNVQKGSFQRMV